MGYVTTYNLEKMDNTERESAFKLQNALFLV